MAVSVSIHYMCPTVRRKPKIETVQEPTFWRAKNTQNWYLTMKSNRGWIYKKLGANLRVLDTPNSIGKPSFYSLEIQWQDIVIWWQNCEKSKCECWNKGLHCLNLARDVCSSVIELIGLASSPFLIACLINPTVCWLSMTGWVRPWLWVSLFSSSVDKHPSLGVISQLK